MCCASNRHLGARTEHEATANLIFFLSAISHYASVHYKLYLNYWPCPATMDVRFWPPVFINCSVADTESFVWALSKCKSGSNNMRLSVKDIHLSLYCSRIFFLLSLLAVAGRGGWGWVLVISWGENTNLIILVLQWEWYFLSGWLGWLQLLHSAWFSSSSYDASALARTVHFR